MKRKFSELDNSYEIDSIVKALEEGVGLGVLRNALKNRDRAEELLWADNLKIVKTAIGCQNDEALWLIFHSVNPETRDKILLGDNCAGICKAVELGNETIVAILLINAKPLIRNQMITARQGYRLCTAVALERRKNAHSVVRLLMEGTDDIIREEMFFAQNIKAVRTMIERNDSEGLVLLLNYAPVGVVERVLSSARYEFLRFSITSKHYEMTEKLCQYSIVHNVLDRTVESLKKITPSSPEYNGAMSALKLMLAYSPDELRVTLIGSVQENKSNSWLDTEAVEKINHAAKEIRVTGLLWARDAVHKGLHSNLYGVLSSFPASLINLTMEYCYTHVTINAFRFIGIEIDVTAVQLLDCQKVNNQSQFYYR